MCMKDIQTNGGPTMNIDRQEVEKKVVGKLVDDILKAGHRIAVSLERGYDVEDMLIGSTDKEKIMKAAFEGDECHLFIQYATGPLLRNEKVTSKGWVFLVFGNSGFDVISDYTVNVEKLVKGANELGYKLEEQFYAQKA